VGAIEINLPELVVGALKVNIATSHYWQRLGLVAPQVCPTAAIQVDFPELVVGALKVDAVPESDRR
jgi:hypothetical protein